MAESPGFLGCIKTRELKILAEKRQFLRIARNLSTAFCFAVALFAAPAFADDPCKNLFDPTKIDAEHYYAPTSGAYMYNDVISVSDLIPVTPGQKYTISGRSSHAQTISHFYTFWDANREFVSGGYGPNTDSSNHDAVWTVTVPNNVSYLRFSFHAGDQNTFQVEEGETATTHVPYNPLCATCQGIIKTYESATGTVSQNGTPSPDAPIEPTFYQQGDMILRKVGDYADSYDAATGKITRRVGVKVLNGTEDWMSVDITGLFYFIGGIGGAADVYGISTHFIPSSPVGGALANMPDKSVRTYSPSYSDSLWLRYLAIDSVETLKQWLGQQYANGTPVTVYYPLAEAVEETLENTTYCADAIKIATTAYNDAQFAPVEAALESAVTTIKDVVANTIVQADAIQNLQDTKQTMPDASGTNGTCPKFRQCLLIETDDGTPQWFPIIDPFKDFITPILANNANITPVDTQRRHYGDDDLCRMLPQTDTESQANNGIAKCTGVAIYNNTAAANTVRGSALKQTEWGYEFKATNIGTNPATDNPNNDEGIVYGISKCVSTDIPAGAYAQPATSTQLNNALWDARPTTMADADKYRRCWCKTTGIAYGGQYYETSAAPWVFYGTAGSAGVCANFCALYCAYDVRYYAGFRSAVLDWAVE